MPTLTEIRLNRAERRLEITFDDATRYSLPAEYLRVESPSAEVQGHGPKERQIIPGCRNVGISAVEPVGHYAIRILFDDGHDTGIFTWDYLHTLGQDQHRRWAAYLDALAAKGLTRDRR
ncbi:MAG TPA: DUF971 domain-containing protein [Candidatus Limnocylindria bacterium]|nr:DUF971 domain-containing protein [Candidatus Limnocylindria bacterium]